MAGSVGRMAFLVIILGFVHLAGAQPKLVLERQEMDLGTVYNGAVVKARIGISNGGTDRLFIRNIRTSCGCTTVKQPKAELKPGEVDSIEVQFESAGFRGSVTKYVHIETNDPANQYASVTITTTVKEEFEPLNRFSLVWFGDLPVGKEASQTYTLKNISDNRISLRKVSTAYKKISVRYDKNTVEPGDTVVVTVAITPDRTGLFNEMVTIETDSKRQTRVPVRIGLVGVTR